MDWQDHQVWGAAVQGDFCDLPDRDIKSLVSIGSHEGHQDSRGFAELVLLRPVGQMFLDLAHCQPLAARQITVGDQVAQCWIDWRKARPLSSNVSIKT